MAPIPQEIVDAISRRNERAALAKKLNQMMKDAEPDERRDLIQAVRDHVKKMRKMALC